MFKELKEQLNDLLSKSFIIPSISPWGELTFSVKKKYGSFRMCIDYRKFNKFKTMNNYTIPTINF